MDRAEVGGPSSYGGIESLQVAMHAFFMRNKLSAFRLDIPLYFSKLSL